MYAPGWGRAIQSVGQWKEVLCSSFSHTSHAHVAHYSLIKRSTSSSRVAACSWLPALTSCILSARCLLLHTMACSMPATAAATAGNTASVHTCATGGYSFRRSL